MKTVKTLIAVVVATIAFNAAAEPLQAQAGRDMAAAKAFASQAASVANHDAKKAAAKPGNVAQQQKARVSAGAASWAGANVSRTAAAYANAVAMDAQNAATTAQQQNAINSLNAKTVSMSGIPTAPKSVAVAPATPKAPVTPTAPPAPTAITNAPANSAINVAANQVAPNTPVQVGNVTTTAGAIAAVDPTAQISMPINSVFSAAPRSNHNDRSNGSHSEGHNGRGAENAHSHAFGGHGYGHDNSKSEGFGGHSHFH